MRKYVHDCVLAAVAMLFTAGVPAVAAARTDGPPSVVEVFFDGNCDDCLTVRHVVLPDVRVMFPEVVLREYDVRNDAGLQRLFAWQERLGVRDMHPVAAVVDGRYYLGGRRAIKEELIACLSGIVMAEDAGPAADTSGPPAEAGARALDDLAGRLSVLVILAAGLADGLNPCAFAVIVFLAGVLLAYGQRRRGLWLAAASFCAGVFTAYLALGFGLLHFLVRMDAWRLAGRGVRLAMAALLLAMALLALRDAWIFRRSGAGARLLVRLPDRWRSTVQRVARAGLMSPRWWFTAFAAGMLVTLLEAPCTGQLYGPVLFYLSRRADAGPVWGLLILYNLMFVVPHMLVFVMAIALPLNGLRLAAWGRAYVVPSKILLAALLMLMAWLLI